MTRAQEILLAYEENPNAVYSINEISKRIKKGYPAVNKQVHELVDEGILKKIAVGRSLLCSINLQNKRAVMLLALNEIQKHKDLPGEVIATANELAKAKGQHNIRTVVYDPEKDEILAVTNDEATINTTTSVTTITLEGLKKKLLEEEAFYKNHVVLEGYEQFFATLGSAEITRRYHPLL